MADNCGDSIFNGTVDEVKKIMDSDQAMKEGVFVHVVLDCRGRRLLTKIKPMVKLRFAGLLRIR